MGLASFVDRLVICSNFPRYTSAFLAEVFHFDYVELLPEILMRRDDFSISILTDRHYSTDSESFRLIFNFDSVEGVNDASSRVDLYNYRHPDYQVINCTSSKATNRGNLPETVLFSDPENRVWGMRYSDSFMTAVM